MQQQTLEAFDAVTFVNEELETKESIIEGGILPQNSIAIVGGISKQGKSVFVLNMAIQNLLRFVLRYYFSLTGISTVSKFIFWEKYFNHFFYKCQ